MIGELLPHQVIAFQILDEARKKRIVIKKVLTFAMIQPSHFYEWIDGDIPTKELYISRMQACLDFLREEPEYAYIGRKKRVWTTRVRTKKAANAGECSQGSGVFADIRTA